MNGANDGKFLTWYVVVPTCTKGKVFVLNIWVSCTMEHDKSWQLVWMVYQAYEPLGYNILDGCGHSISTDVCRVYHHGLFMLEREQHGLYLSFRC